MNKSVSPSRTYVALCSNLTRKGYSGYTLKKFVLPQMDSEIILENDSAIASWYFLNRLDSFNYIEGCISYEDLEKVLEPNPDNLVRPVFQLSEARNLLNHIKEELLNGQISEIIGDISSFFENYPDIEESSK